MISIVTATYNRESLLKRLYDSLCKQESKSFEWIVIDDGSIDNTENLITEFKNENIINILYLRKENGGKHTALNLGVELANFPYIFFVDSDDILPKNSIQIVTAQIKYIKLQPDYDQICGVCGLMTSFDGDLIGTKLNRNIICSTIDYRYKYRVLGDKAEVFKKEVLLNYLFPVFSNEKFCPEALIWNRISQKYKMYFFNEVIYFREYLPGGLTSKIFEIRKKSPNATLIYYKELFENRNVSVIFRIRALINFWRFYYSADLSCYFGNKPISNINFLIKPFIRIYLKLKQ